MVRPDEINPEGTSALLPNVCWTCLGPIHLDDPPGVGLRARAARLAWEVRWADKFPQMIDCVVTTGARIADGRGIRLGADLGRGTTVMHDGFANYKAGTLGLATVAGRIRWMSQAG
jgi:2,3,4,5-tetrahydropyridine-2,6-dicarboxylate N-succinyltransferase